MNKQGKSEHYSKPEVVLITGNAIEQKRLKRLSFPGHVELEHGVTHEMDYALRLLGDGQSVVISADCKEPTLPVWVLGYCEMHNVPIWEIKLESCKPYAVGKPVPESRREKMRREIRAQLEAEMKREGNKTND